MEYKGEYHIKDILEHFLKQFSNRYKYKVWMMMRRKDGVISDYELIWEGRFRDWYPNKYKFNCVPKETYGGHIRVRKKASDIKAKEITNQLKPEEAERIEREREEKRRLAIKRREEYLSKLFEREAKEREERLRKAREDEAYLKDRARESMLATLEKSRVVDMGVDIENNRDNSALYESMHNPPRPVEIVLKNNFEGFKTTKGISIANLGIMLPNEEQNQILGEKEI
ncbi:hypothetical protein [Borrelia hermsii]|uniref:hypothetical protein n=1 Tax=Borrelia hermsii TaxID=140 RepID=UPI001F1E0892|nr:hypothetical protein [Borrelia hermsii]